MLERRKADDAWVVDTDGSGSRRLTRGTSVFAASWSPSSRQVAVISIHANQHSDAHLYLVAAKGGQPRLLSDEEVVGGPAWTPDGRWITFSTADGKIHRVHPDGSGSETIGDIPGKYVTNLSWSPDGLAPRLLSQPA